MYLLKQFFFFLVKLEIRRDELKEDRVPVSASGFSRVLLQHDEEFGPDPFTL